MDYRVLIHLNAPRFIFLLICATNKILHDDGDIDDNDDLCSR